MRMRTKGIKCGLFHCPNIIRYFGDTILDLVHLPRTQASLCKKKTVMRIGRVYMKYCSGDRWAKGLMGRVHLNCETPGSSWSISCKKVDFLQVVIFRCRLRFFATCFC